MKRDRRLQPLPGTRGAPHEARLRPHEARLRLALAQFTAACAKGGSAERAFFDDLRRLTSQIRPERVEYKLSTEQSERLDDGWCSLD